METVTPLWELSFENNHYIKDIEGKHFLNLKDILRVACENEFGVLAANCIRPEIVKGVLRAAFDLKSPVIIQVAESQVGYALNGWFKAEEPGKKFGLLNQFSEFVSDEARRLYYDTGYWIPIGLHLDHLQKDKELARDALNAGFTSVELDFSKQPTEDRTKAVVMNAQQCIPLINELHKYGVTAEVEEGEIGEAAVRGEQSLDKIMAELTAPKDAVELVRLTNGDALAVFVGSAHWHYKRTPFLSFKRIKQISDALEEEALYAPLVLHGGTGLSNEDFQHAVRNGARKFNYATALASLFLDAVRESEVKGTVLVEKMDKAEKKQAEAKGAKPRGSRYVLGQFADEINQLNPRTLIAAENKVYGHVAALIGNGMGSEGKSALYGIEYQ